MMDQQIDLRTGQILKIDRHLTLRVLSIRQDEILLAVDSQGEEPREWECPCGQRVVASREDVDGGAVLCPGCQMRSFWEEV